MEMGIIKVGGYMALSYQYGAGMGEAGDTPAGGTNLMEIPTKVEYAGKDSLTIYTTKSAARVGTEKALHMNNQNDRFKLDFMPIGQDIKRGRKAKNVTREQLSEVIGYAPRHIQAIENEGQTPSVDLLFQLAEMFDVSLDRHIFKDRDNVKSSVRRRVDTLLDGLVDKDLVIVEAVIKGIHQAKEVPEE